MSQLQTLQDLILNTESAFQSVLVDQSISFQREAEFATQIILGADYLQSVAKKAPQTLIDAVINVAAIGISLNPAKKHAYLVPRKGKICLDISYMGLMDLAIQSGSIKWAQAEVVYENDNFEIISIDRAPVHKRDPFKKDRGEMVGVYVVAKTADGDYLTDTMTKEEIDSIMNRSESVKSGKASPWKTDYTEMAKKTVVKRAQKYWPKTERLEAAVHHMDTDGGEGIILNENEQQLSSDEVESILSEIESYSDAGELRSLWKPLLARIKGKASVQQHDYIRQVFAEKGRSLEKEVKEDELPNN